MSDVIFPFQDVSKTSQLAVRAATGEDRAPYQLHAVAKLSIIFDHETATKKPNARFLHGGAARDIEA
jgi:hypothetical protein